jgi:hypothetical protein
MKHRQEIGVYLWSVYVTSSQNIICVFTKVCLVDSSIENILLIQRGF